MICVEFNIFTDCNEYPRLDDEAASYSLCFLSAAKPGGKTNLINCL